MKNKNINYKTLGVIGVLIVLGGFLYFSNGGLSGEFSRDVTGNVVGSLTETGIFNKVGIGTNKPGAKLDVRDQAGTPAAAPVIYVNRPNNLVSPDPSQAALYIKDHEANYPLQIVSLPSGKSIFTIKGNGNVGIGTNNPGAKLDVNGLIRVSDLKINPGAPNFKISIAQALRDMTGGGTVQGTSCDSLCSGNGKICVMALRVENSQIVECTSTTGNRWCGCLI